MYNKETQARMVRRARPAAPAARSPSPAPRRVSPLHFYHNFRMDKFKHLYIKYIFYCIKIYDYWSILNYFTSLIHWK